MAMLGATPHHHPHHLMPLMVHSMAATIPLLLPPLLPLPSTEVTCTRRRGMWPLPPTVTQRPCRTPRQPCCTLLALECLRERTGIWMRLLTVRQPSGCNPTQSLSSPCGHCASSHAAARTLLLATPSVCWRSFVWRLAARTSGSARALAACPLVSQAVAMAPTHHLASALAYVCLRASLLGAMACLVGM